MSSATAGRKAYKLAITLRSPFLFAALDIAAPGFDASALRNAKGELIIPGDHLRGHLRHAICALHGENSAMAKALFGAASDDEQDNARNEPVRGALIIGDLTETAPDKTKDKTSIYHRVQIDDETGAANTGMLQLIELPLGIGASMTFEGRLVLRPAGKDKPSLADMEKALNNALRLISAMGAVKSSGFGEVAHDTKPPTLTADNGPAAGSASLPAGDRLLLTVKFDRPLLVDSRKDGRNTFSSSTIVPGGAIKGALALALMDAGRLAENCPEFAKLSISHAFPLAGEVLADHAIPNVIAAVTAPASKEIKFANALDEEVFSQLADIGVPAFPTDWKNTVFTKVRGVINRPEADLARASRGRVAIGNDGVAEDAKLFTVNLVETTGSTWQFTIDLAGLTEVLKADIRAVLASGLDGIGRTGARMSVTVASEAPPPQKSTASSLDILLETPAVLTLPNDGRTPLEQYQAYFKSIGADLVAVFAQREWAGGYYGHRFRAFGDTHYCPFELTLPGAVFRLNITNADTFSAALAGGLPCLLPSGLAEAADWRKTPFLPQNGYGAISLLDTGAIDELAKGASNER